uniref:Uncharacterized protein n=1 Tax=Candidatus Methanogaster sp. ANME-2c ERB4 TaxID=2759911 RepID=A0A7G9YJW3_9EURY|nr:hypothetical protein DHHKMHHO_00001 [Methanosarcinales archaeon ANME-2c ERB4]
MVKVDHNARICDVCYDTRSIAGGEPLSDRRRDSCCAQIFNRNGFDQIFTAVLVCIFRWYCQRSLFAHSHANDTIVKPFNHLPGADRELNRLIRPVRVVYPCFDCDVFHRCVEDGAVFQSPGVVHQNMVAFFDHVCAAITIRVYTSAASENQCQQHANTE